MSDRRLRELERRARGGDPAATGQLAVERSRRGLASSIDRAYACWVAGDRGGALDLLVERWCALPAPGLADAIGHLTAHVARPRGAIPGRTRAELIKSWRQVEASGDRLDVPRLLEALRRLRCQEANGLLAAAERWPRDPRVSAGLVDYFEQPPGDWRGQANTGFWLRALGLLRAGADPRTGPRLQKVLADRGERYLAALGDLFTQRLPGLIRELPGSSAELEPAERASLASLVASTEGPDLTGAWAAVRARPDDDAARLALAEGLERTGDSRGEFIRLQVERGRSGKPSAREQALLEESWRSWLDGLELFVARKKDVQFERGLLAVVPVHVDALDEQTLPVLARAPAWATLRRVVFPYAGDFDPVDLLDALPRVPPEVFGVVHSVLGRSFPITGLGLRRTGPAELPRLCGPTTLPLVRALDLGAWVGEAGDLPGLEAVWSGPLGRQLEHAAIAFPAPLFWEGAAALVPGAALPLQTLTIRPAKDWYECPWSLLFWRGPAERLSRLRIVEERSVPHQPPLKLLARALARRPRALEGLDRIELLLRPSTARRTSPETLERMEAALAAFGPTEGQQVLAR